jgi:hypothetical protein
MAMERGIMQGLCVFVDDGDSGASVGAEKKGRGVKEASQLGS